MRGTQVVADYKAFARAAAGIGAALRGRGVEPGDRVAIFMGNCTEYLEALYGIWFAGAAAVPINCKLHVKEVAGLLANSGASIVFVSDDTDRGIGGAHSDAAIIAVTGAEFSAMKQTSPLEAPIPMDASDLAWLFYTSGTTGDPKGVMISAGSIQAMTLCYFADVDVVRREDAALYAAPMSHGAGLYNFMHVLRGARHVVPESGRFDPGEILSLAPQVGPVSLFAAPTMVRRLVDEARNRNCEGEGLRTIVYAGGPMYLADILKAVDVMGSRFVQIYGQGECPMAITALPREDVADRDHPDWRQRLASVGRPQSAVEVRVVDPNGRVLPAGKTGEIIVKGAAVMKGYWNNPGATAATLKKGWLWTGDLGAFDDQGYLTLRDRSKDVIISGGSNIYPREVEEVILTHPDVCEVAVVGEHNPEWGEQVTAFVVLRPDVEASHSSLDLHCLDNMARFKRPRAYHFVKKLPKNNYGKVLKSELRQWLAGG